MIENATEQNSSRGVRARQLTKEFDGEQVITDLDLVVEPGQIVGLIGPSGCGKTTTVRLLTGLLSPTTGTAEVNGTVSTELTAAERARIGYLPQSPALFPDLSLVENLSFHASMYGLPLRRRKRLDEMLDWVELSEHRKKRVCDSSGGMQRRLALAAAFVHHPDVVFLDEPTAGIDPILRDKFWARFHDLADGGRSIIVTTQYVGEAGECDVVGLLSAGELLLLDTPANLRRAAFAGEVIDVTLERPASDEELRTIESHDFVIGSIERLGADGVRIVVDDATEASRGLREALATVGVGVVDVSEHIVDYDEAFVQIVERHRQDTNDDGDDKDDEGDDGGYDGDTTAHSTVAIGDAHSRNVEVPRVGTA